MFTHKNNEDSSKEVDRKVNEMGVLEQVVVTANGYKLSSEVMKILQN